MNNLEQAGLFLIQTIFDFFILLVLLRLIFQLIKADFYNPVSQMIVKLTAPLIIPLRRILPSIHKIDTASLTVLFILCLLKLFLVSLIQFNKAPAFVGLFIWSFGELISLTLNLFFYAILIQIILNWIAPKTHSPITPLLYQLTSPLLTHARKHIPPFQGLDLSPIPVLIILKILIILIATPIINYGITSAFFTRG